MIRLAAVLVPIVIASGLFAAEPIVLRSGEHAGFSRIVLRLPDGASWALTRSGRRAELTLGLPGLVFDATQVFQRIPRTRLLEVTQGSAGDALVLRLGCDCDVTGFTEGATHLVIDIADPKPQSRPPFPLIRPANQTVYRFRSPPPQQDAATMPPGVAPAVQAASPDIVPGLLLQGATLHPARTDRINASERRLFDQIGRAIGQGLLDVASPTGPADWPDRPEHRPDPPLRPQSGDPAPKPSRRPDPSDIRNVAVSTAIESAQDAAARRKTRAKPDICALSRHVDLNAWSDGRPFAAQIGELRSKLFSEFDRTDPERALTLARVYLFFGFGAEAQQILTLVPDQSDAWRIAWALADLIDARPDAGDPPFLGAEACAGDAAMWAVLSGARAGDADASAVTRAFARLPAHLRVHLGPQLAERFAEAGDRATAETLLRAVARTGVPDDAAVDLAAAKVAELGNDATTAAHKLERVAGSGSDLAPTALIRLIENHWRDRSPIPPDLPDLAAAYALEFRHAEIGPDLRRAHSRSLALADRFAEAMVAVAALGALDGPAAQTGAALSVLDLITERGGDIEFLRYALPIAQTPPVGLANSLGDAIARRLLDLGFARPALQILDNPAGGVAAPERRLLRARSALALALPHRALVELLGIDSADATRLRARALSRIGEFRQAADQLASQDPDAATRNLWLSADTLATEDSKATSGGGATRYQQIARLTARLGEPADSDGAGTPLARARALIDASAAARQDIGALLETVGSGRPGS